MHSIRYGLDCQTFHQGSILHPVNEEPSLYKSFSGGRIESHARPIVSMLTFAVGKSEAILETPDLMTYV